MVLEEDCVASESVSGGWTVEDSVLETWSGPEVSLLQAEKLKRSIPARKKGKIRFIGVLLPDCYDRLRLSSHSCISPSLTLERKRIPSCQSPVPASSASSCPLSPKPELAEVANGITVLPVKSFASTNVSTGHAAIPHQMGN